MTVETRNGPHTAPRCRSCEHLKRSALAACPRCDVESGVGPR